MDSVDTEPFAADGGRVGVVLSHGFTGTPGSMRPWAEHLAASGYTVRLPLLPGHDGTWRDINRTTWQQWYAAVQAAFAEVRERCDVVFAGGLSMGATLVTRLAEQYPRDIRGLVLVNPAYGIQRLDARFAPYIAWAVRSRPSIGGDIKKPGVLEPAGDRTPLIAFTSLQKLWRVTVADLPAVRAPIRLYRSSVDHVVDELSERLLRAGAVNTDIDKVVLSDSYHVATLDNDAPTIFDGSVQFIEALAGVPLDPETAS